MKKCLPAVLGAVLFLWTASGSPAAEQGAVFGRIGPVEVLGDSRHYIDAGAGVFDFQDKDDKISAAGRFELRIGKKFHFVGPAIGLLANTDGGVYGYAGIYADFVYGRFVLTPVLSIGGYRQGNSMDLGGVFEFRESLGLAYRIDGRSRIGIEIAHVSNANIYSVNPGENDIMATCGIEF